MADPSNKKTSTTAIAAAEKFAVEYIQGLVKTLKEEKSINAAVKERQILIINPKVSNENNAKLSDVQDQFNENGQRKKDATFVYHSPERTETEMAYQLDTKRMSDWEKIAFVSAYFKVASDVILKNAVLDPSNKKISQYVEEIRMLCANELRAVVGFKKSPGYETNDATNQKLSYLLSQVKQIAKIAHENIVFSEELKAIKDEVLIHKKDIEKRSKNTISDVDQMKLNMLNRAIEAIDHYDKNKDLYALMHRADEIALYEKVRKKGLGTHTMSKLINRLTKKVKEFDTFKASNLLSEEKSPTNEQQRRPSSPFFSVHTSVSSKEQVHKTPEHKGPTSK